MTKKVAGVFLIGVALLVAACSVPASVTIRTPEISQSQAINNSATIGVHDSEFQVIVTAEGPAWIQVTGGLGQSAYDVLQAGDTYTAASSKGKVSVLFGSTQLKVAVQIGTRTVPTWHYSPPRAPFTLNFASTNGPPGVLIAA
jgi:hypothetical protein